MSHTRNGSAARPRGSEATMTTSSALAWSG